MDTTEIILIGYGVALAFCIWENTKAQDRLANHAEVLEEIISKHNKLTEDIADFADEINEALDDIPRDD